MCKTYHICFGEALASPGSGPPPKLRYSGSAFRHETVSRVDDHKYYPAIGALGRGISYLCACEACSTLSASSALKIRRY